MSLALELGGGAYHSILFSQVWSATEEDRGQADDVVLRTEAQSAISSKNECIRPYASLSKLCGVRKQAMDLIGDCQKKGATRLIEDLALADPRQHPCNLLPGDNLPACSALFLPIYDPANPFSRNKATGQPLPCAVLEVLVCKRAQFVHNHSDLMNAVSHVMEHYQLGVSADMEAFRQWSRNHATPGTLPSGVLTPRRPSPSAMSRTSSMFLLNSDSDDAEDLQLPLASAASPGVSKNCQSSTVPCATMRSTAWLVEIPRDLDYMGVVEDFWPATGCR